MSPRRGPARWAPQPHASRDGEVSSQRRSETRSWSVVGRSCQRRPSAARGGELKPDGFSRAIGLGGGAPAVRDCVNEAKSASVFAVRAGGPAARDLGGGVCHGHPQLGRGAPSRQGDLARPPRDAPAAVLHRVGEELCGGQRDIVGDGLKTPLQKPLAEAPTCRPDSGRVRRQGGLQMRRGHARMGWAGCRRPKAALWPHETSLDQSWRRYQSAVSHKLVPLEWTVESSDSNFT